MTGTLPNWHQTSVEIRSVKCISQSCRNCTLHDTTLPLCMRVKQREIIVVFLRILFRVHIHDKIVTDRITEFRKLVIISRKWGRLSGAGRSNNPSRILTRGCQACQFLDQWEGSTLAVFSTETGFVIRYPIFSCCLFIGLKCKALPVWIKASLLYRF